MYQTNMLLLLTACSAYGSHIVENSFYGKLNIHLSIKNPELSRAFRKQATPLHPDKNKDLNAIEQFKDLNHMYQTLKDPTKQKEYDTELATELLKSNSAFAHIIAYQMQEENSMKKLLWRVFFFISPFSLCCKKDNEYAHEDI